MTEEESDLLAKTESELRAALVHLETTEFINIVERMLGESAATDIQRLFRGHTARKRVRVRRKRLLHTALLMQRVSRGGFARRNIKLLRIVLEQPHRKRLVMKYRYLQRGEIVVPRVAAAYLLQRFARRIPSIVRVQHVRDMFQYVIRCAISIQALAKRAQARRRFASVLLERKRQRHERLLKDFVERQVAVRTLQRVERQTIDGAHERAVCRIMLERRCTYREALAEAASAFAMSDMHAGVRLASKQSTSKREAAFSAFCNRRRVTDLGDRDTTDSDDDSIDEELLRPQRKPVKLVGSRRKKLPNTEVVDSSTSGWLLRSYPGETPAPVPKLSRSVSKYLLARTPSVARRILVPDFDDDGAKTKDVFSRLSHHWF